jgi:hypothetical protein
MEAISLGWWKFCCLTVVMLTVEDIRSPFVAKRNIHKQAESHHTKSCYVIFLLVENWC